MNEKTNMVHVYACYLPGSERPDYIGSHVCEPSDTDGAAAWRNKNCVYVGQGGWIDKEGILMGLCRTNRRTLWGKQLLIMSAADRLAMRIETLATVDAGVRWKAEAQAIRDYKPPFNALVAQDAETKRLKHNAYHRSYQKGYYAARPARAEAKRKADRERIRAKRAQDKAAKEACRMV